MKLKWEGTVQEIMPDGAFAQQFAQSKRKVLFISVLLIEFHCFYADFTAQVLQSFGLLLLWDIQVCFCSNLVFLKGHCLWAGVAGGRFGAQRLSCVPFAASCLFEVGTSLLFCEIFCLKVTRQSRPRVSRASPLFFFFFFPQIPSVSALMYCASFFPSPQIALTGFNICFCGAQCTTSLLLCLLSSCAVSQAAQHVMGQVTVCLLVGKLTTAMLTEGKPLLENEGKT